MSRNQGGYDGMNIYIELRKQNESRILFGAKILESLKDREEFGRITSG
jgi:hypothetical protein